MHDPIHAVEHLSIIEVDLRGTLVLELLLSRASHILRLKRLTSLTQSHRRGILDFLQSGAAPIILGLVNPFLDKPAHHRYLSVHHCLN